MEDVRAVSSQEPDELDETGDISWSDRPPHVPEWHEARARCHGRVTKWACAVSSDRDLEALDERREQRRDVGLCTPDLRERNQQQDPRPPRRGS